VVRIWFAGVLTRELDGGWLGTVDPVEDCLRQIRAARQDPDVAGILLEVDSPGGEVTAADEIHRELTLFKGQPRGSQAGGAGPRFGGVGRLLHLGAGRPHRRPADGVDRLHRRDLQTLNVQGLSEKIGVTDTTIKSGKNKDLLNPFHAVDPEQVALLQESVDALHDRFVELVAAGRALKKSDVRHWPTGGSSPPTKPCGTS
jgi:protease-4